MERNSFGSFAFLSLTRNSGPWEARGHFPRRITCNGIISIELSRHLRLHFPGEIDGPPQSTNGISSHEANLVESIAGDESLATVSISSPLATSPVTRHSYDFLRGLPSVVSFPANNSLPGHDLSATIDP